MRIAQDPEIFCFGPHDQIETSNALWRMGHSSYILGLRPDMSVVPTLERA